MAMLAVSRCPAWDAFQAPGQVEGPGMPLPSSMSSGGPTWDMGPAGPCATLGGGAMPRAMAESSPLETRAPTVVYVDSDAGQLRRFESQFGGRFRVRLSARGEGLLDRVEPVAPVAALLADHRSGQWLFEAAPAVLPDTERLLVARSAELSKAREAVERGAAKRYFVKPWAPG